MPSTALRASLCRIDRNSAVVLAVRLFVIVFAGEGGESWLVTRYWEALWHVCAMFCWLQPRSRGAVSEGLFITWGVPVGLGGS